MRYEIVDHLASGIEARMEENPDLSFDAALRKEYAKFPITGFYQFVQEKQKALSKYWRRKMVNFFLDTLLFQKSIYHF